MKIYYGINEDTRKPIYAMVTGQMSDNTLVYTEIKTNPDGSIVTDSQGDPVLIIDSQYTRHLRYGTQTFCEL